MFTSICCFASYSLFSLGLLRPIRWRPAPASLGLIDPVMLLGPSRNGRMGGPTRVMLLGPTRNGKSARNVEHRWPVWDLGPLHKNSVRRQFFFLKATSPEFHTSRIFSSKDSEGSKLKVAILIRLFNQGSELEQSFRSSLPVLRL